MSCLNKLLAVIAGGFALSIFAGDLNNASDMDTYIFANSVQIFEGKLCIS